jgi:hypothetical protein
MVATSSGAANAHAAKTPTLLSLVVSAPSGFKSSPTDPTSRDRTGSVNIKVAGSADCDPTTLPPAQWVASVLKYYDDDASRPNAALIICVTQFRTASDATANRIRILSAIGSSAIALKDIPGTYLHAVASTEQIFFAKGVYFVRVTSTDVSGTAMALTLGQNLTLREYNRLPE